MICFSSDLEGGWVPWLLSPQYLNSFCVLTAFFFFLLLIKMDFILQYGEFKSRFLAPQPKLFHPGSGSETAAPSSVPTSVYLRAAAPIIKVVFSGHLVSGEPLNVSLCPGVFTHTHNSSLNGFSPQSRCCLRLFFVLCSWKTRRVASQRVFPLQQTLLMGNRVDPHFPSSLSRHSDCTEHPEMFRWRFTVRPSRVLPPQGQTKA